MPRALDLFCGAGGASKGLADAGYEVIGVDINPQPRYPFEFHQADAMTYPLEGFDLIWASPPCQGYSKSRHIHGGSNAPLLIESMRERLQANGAPWVIENVVGAPLQAPLMLCGTMFGLQVLRHRLFETSWAAFGVPHLPHPRRDLTGSSRTKTRNPSIERGEIEYVCVSGHVYLLGEGRQAMGIDWMSRDELSQAIPPAYSRFIAASSPALAREAVSA